MHKLVPKSSLKDFWLTSGKFSGKQQQLGELSQQHRSSPRKPHAFFCSTSQHSPENVLYTEGCKLPLSAGNSKPCQNLDLDVLWKLSSCPPAVGYSDNLLLWRLQEAVTLEARIWGVLGREIFLQISSIGSNWNHISDLSLLSNVKVPLWSSPVFF